MDIDPDKIKIYTYMDQYLEEYDAEYAQHANNIQFLVKSLVNQRLHGCKQPDCENLYCATGIRNTTTIPVRDCTPRSARILALDLLGKPNPEAHLCKHVKSGGEISTSDIEEGPRDPSSLPQRIADTSCMRRLAEGLAPSESHFEQVPELRKVGAITAQLQKQCEPPFDAWGSPNPLFVYNKEVANTVALALDLFYDLLPETGSQALWQSLAQCINNGQVVPAQTLESNVNNRDLVELCRIFDFQPCTRMCAQICKVIALRTQVEDITAKCRRDSYDAPGKEDILSLVADRITSIARWQTASRKNSWVPWPYPLWLKKTFLQHWDGKSAVKRGTVACGALELLEMQTKIWDRSNPEKTSDACLLPFIYNRTDVTEVVRSWMKHDPPVTTTSRHLLSFPFLYSNGQVLMNFRTLNHLRMREAHTASHVNEELYDRYIAISDTASLEWDSNGRQTFHLRDFYLLLSVRRDHIARDAFDQLWQRRKCELLRPLRVRLGEMEHTELGQDLGGVQIEFFNLVCKELFSEDAGMFTTDSITGLSFFRPGSLQPLYMFELFGLLVALALYNGITIPVNFPLAFYKHLLGLPCDELRDIQDGWPDIAQSLQSIKDGAYEDLEYAFPLEANGLRLSLNHAALETIRSQAKAYTSGERSTLDLQVSEMSQIDATAPSSSSTTPYHPTYQTWPGWNVLAPKPTPSDPINNNNNDPDPPTSTPLTPTNTPTYTTTYTTWLTHLSIHPQLHALLTGFHTLLPTHHLKLFTPTTLCHILQGSQTLDLAALRAVTVYQDYSPSEPYIQAFWAMLSRWPDAKQKSLLKFVTAAERWPVTGVGSLTFRIHEAPVEGVLGGGSGSGRGMEEEQEQDEGKMLLPTSSTCFGTLWLPRYRDVGVLERRLGVALEFGGEGFGTA